MPTSGPWKTRLVGRDAELARLEAERRQASSGELRCVLVLADAGLGKTRLAGELLARHRRTTIGLSARAFPLGGTAPFALWAEALESHLRTLSAEEVGAVCGGFTDDLAGLCRSVAAARGGAPDTEVPRTRLLEGVTLAVGNLAAQAPVVAVLDDAHLADASSWEALHYLSRNAPTAPVLLVVTARPGELSGPAAEVLAGLDREGRLTRLTLDPLESDGVWALAEAVLGEAPPPGLVDWLRHRSQGNPLYTLGLLNALLEEDVDLSAPDLRQLPETLTDQVASRLARLDEPSLATLEVLAVVGRAVELGDVLRLSGRPLDRLSEILDRLVRLRLVVESEQPQPTYEIAHPLMTEAIYQRISGARRVALHRLVGRALLAGGRLAEAAAHFARSAEPGDPEAVEVLRQAVGQAEEAGAHREALAVLSSLVALVPPGDERWRGIVDAMSLRAEWVVDHRAEIHAAEGAEAMRAIDAVLAEVPDPARQAGVKFRLANFCAWGTGELEEAERSARAAMELFEVADDVAGALLARNELAWVRGLRGELDALELGAAEVLSAAEAEGLPFVVVQALIALGYAGAHRGRFGPAEVSYRRALELARAEGMRHQQSRLLAHLALTLALEGRLADSLPLLAEGISVDPAYRDSLVLEFGAVVHWLAGDFPAALVCAEEAMAWNPAGVSRRRGIGVVFGALAAAETGDLGEARRFADAARQALGDRDWSYLRHYCDYVDGFLAAREGQITEALAALERAAAGIPRSQAWPYLAFVLVDLAELAAVSGERERSAAAARAMAELAARTGCDFHGGLAALAGAWGQLAAGNDEAAAGTARHAIKLLEPTGARAFSARAAEILGRALGPEERAAAVGVLEQAACAFEASSATCRHQRALEVLRSLGGTGRRAAAAVSGPGSLTRREREVARLAAQGRSAREIGTQLFIGERTVETHLANAYAKLGVTSKLDLVRRAAELGL
ncbi:MAG TPA: AAA family ATPase [Acidimicrobiia bacterium]